MSSNLKKIDEKTALLIASGQVITDMSMAVKEMLENSLDAGARCITVRFVVGGIETIEVMDDGCGIRFDSFDILGGRGCTSKLDTFEELSNVKTFGFRGEAINSMCNIGELSIHSKHGDESIGTLVKFDGQGRVIHRERKARATGTTITLAKLFKPLPVRRKELLANSRRAFDRTLTLVQQYALGLEGVKFTVINQSTLAVPPKTIFTCQGRSLVSNLVEMFEHRQLDRLMLLEKCNDIAIEEKQLEPIEFELDGYISKPDTGCGRSSNDRQYFFMNGRPVELKMIAKGLNRLYRTYNRHQYPFIVMRIVLPESIVDRNITPDKRYVLLGDNKYVAKVIEQSVVKLFQRASVAVPSFDANRSELMEQFVSSSRLKRPAQDNSEDEERLIQEREQVSKVFKRGNSPSDDSFVSLDKLPDLDSSRDLDNFLKNVAPEKEQEPKKPFMHPFFGLVGSSDSQQKDKPTQFSKRENKIEQKSSLDRFLNSNKMNFFDKITDASDPPELRAPVEDCLLTTNTTPTSTKTSEPSMDFITPAPVIPTTLPSFVPALDNENNLEQNHQDVEESENEEDNEFEDEVCINARTSVCMDVTIDSIQKRFSQQLSLQNMAEECLSSHNQFSAQIDPKENEEAERQLRVNFDKINFSRLEVIGQFNSGFIIGQLGTDVFIVDQHALDERCNFESLLARPDISLQSCLAPIKLKLDVASELIVLDHLDIFKRLGFNMFVDEESAPGERLMVTSVPVGRTWIGDRQDVQEIVAAIRASPTGNVLDPSGSVFKMSKMVKDIGYQACRSAIMFGDKLTKSKMVQLLAKAVNLDDPWHCAHNRPTIRHLANVTDLEREMTKQTDDNLYRW